VHRLTVKMVESLRKSFPHFDRVQYRDGKPIGRKCYDDCNLCLIERILHLTSTKVDHGKD